MLNRIGVIAMAITLLMGLMSFNVDDAVKAWEKIGSKKVDFKLDKDVMVVGADDGRFQKLKLVVSGGNLNMHRMVVHFGNGSKEEVELRHNFSKASTSRIIDLPGNRRFIKKLTFIYDTKGGSARKAKLSVFGRH